MARCAGRGRSAWADAEAEADAAVAKLMATPPMPQQAFADLAKTERRSGER
jgi:hypothetical protein